MKDKVDMTDFNTLLSGQCDKNVEKNQQVCEQTSVISGKQREQLLKVYRQFQRRQEEQFLKPQDFPEDYFFSAMAELVLSDL